MNAISFLGNPTMRPSQCILRAFTRISRFSSCINQNNSDVNRIISRSRNAAPFCTDRQSSVASQVVSEARRVSASTTCADDTTVDRINTNKGLNVKPLDVERLKGDGFEGIKSNEAEEEAWRLLRDSVVTYCDSPVGTVAAKDPTDTTISNYDQVFVRDFVPSALAFLLKGESQIVRNFLLHTLQLQSWEKTVDCYSPGQGLMPASFKVRTLPLQEDKFEEILDPDFGEAAIGRVAPVDSDRRMGIHGHPLEIQALFYSALRSSREMLTVNESSKNIIKTITNRLSALSFHIRENYWVDKNKINEIYRYKTEEYSMDATNKFNIYPDQVSPWLMDWVPESSDSGFLIGNLQPAHMDFRFFTLGNLWAIISSLGTQKMNQAILNLIEEKWDDLIGHMPLKICFPALETAEWNIITGSDPKNTPWSYHNGGSWPTLLVAEKRLQADRWPEYYDTRNGKFIGKQSRLYQTWTIAGFLTSKHLLQNPELASSLFWDEDLELLETCVCVLTKSGRKKCSRAAAKSQILI